MCLDLHLLEPQVYALGDHNAHNIVNAISSIFSDGSASAGIDLDDFPWRKRGDTRLFHGGSMAVTCILVAMRMASSFLNAATSGDFVLDSMAAACKM